MNQSAQHTKEDIQHLLPIHVPEFRDKKITIELIVKGFTNQTYKVTAQSAPSVIFQIFAKELDKNYTKIIEKIAPKGICPKIFFACQSYRIEEFIQEVKPLYQINIFDNIELLKKILEKLYKLHQTELPEDIEKKSFLDIVIFGEHNNKKRLNATCTQIGRQVEYYQMKKDLMQQNSKLKSKIEKNFEKKSQYFRLCHNDFQLRNILLKTTEQGQEPFLIDLEYVSYNYIAYDIANLLSEACYDASYRKVRSLTKEDIQKVCELYPGKYEGIEEDVTFLLAVPNYFYSIWALTGPPLKHVCLLDLGLEKLQMYKYYMERAQSLQP